MISGILSILSNKWYSFRNDLSVACDESRNLCYRVFLSQYVNKPAKGIHKKKIDKQIFLKNLLLWQLALNLGYSKLRMFVKYCIIFT